MTSSLPRVLWLLWLQGWDEAPPVAQACLASWRRLNPTWEIRAIDGLGTAEYLSAHTFERIATVPKEPEAFSDQIRIELLHAHGGVWADATAMCAVPLDLWLPQRMESGFFAFERPTPDRMIASWFLAASESSRIIAKWRAEVAAYWVDRQYRDDYFWFHTLFATRYEQDETFRVDWDATPSLPAQHAFHFGPEDRRLYLPPAPDYVEALRAPPSPVFKLTHKLTQAVGSDSLLRSLCDFGRGVPAR